MIDGSAGVTAMDTSVAEVIVSVVEPLMAPFVAVIVLVPVVALEARPLEPLVLLILATDLVEELHVTDVVRSCVVASVYVPVAVNCSVVPSAIAGFAGVISMDWSDLSGGPRSSSPSRLQARENAVREAPMYENRTQ